MKLIDWHLMHSSSAARELLVALTINISLYSIACAQNDVVATIKPVHSLVSQVMGDTGKPELLVDGSASPHSYVLKPSDAAKLASAAIVFRVSAAMEPFTVKAARLLGKSAKLVTLQDAPSVTTLPLRVGGPFEGHDHDHEHHDDQSTGDKTNIDGHVWLEPTNAKAMLDEIARRLSERTPSLSAIYEANAAAAKARIDALAVDLERQLSPVSEKPYVVFHDAYQYFEKRYRLNVVGSITANPDIPSSGKRLSRLRERILSLKAVCVFGEPNFDSKVIRAVTEGSAARGGVLDPEGASLPAGPELYDQLMRSLAADLVKCLAP